MSDREKLTEAEREALDVMGMFPTSGGLADPAAWERDVEARLAATVERIVAERVAQEREAVLDEVALRLSRLIPMYTLGMDLTEARAIALHDAIRTVRDLRATTQDGER